MKPKILLEFINKHQFGQRYKMLIKVSYTKTNLDKNSETNTLMILEVR